jgi:hypothetical protein
MTFSEALVALKAGKEVRRTNWPDESSVRLSKDSSNCPAFIRANTVKEGYFYWMVGTEDLLAEDWEMAE